MGVHHGPFGDEHCHSSVLLLGRGQDATGQDGKACLLASYDDDVSVTFWEGLRKTTAQTPLWGGASPPSSPQVAGNWSDYRARRPPWPRRCTGS